MKKSNLTVINNTATTQKFTPPKSIPKPLHQLYIDICNHLQSGGKFHFTDTALVEQYVLTLHESEVARKIFTAEGMIVASAQGTKAHPAVGICNQARTTASKLAACLSLSPVHRNKIAAAVESLNSEVSDWHTIAGGK